MTILAFSDQVDSAENVPFASTIDQVLQYKQAFFKLWNDMVAIADSVLFSCTGSANAVGNIITAAGESAITIAAAAGTAHTYGAILFGVDVYIIEALTANPTTFPVTMSVWKSCSAYPAPSSNTTRPVATTASRENTAITSRLIGWSAPSAGFINSKYSRSAGALIFTTKLTANGSAASAMIITHTDPTNANGGDAPTSVQPRGAVYFFGAAANGALSSGNLNVTTNWRCNGRGLDANGSNAFAQCFGWDYSSWPFGQDSLGQGDPFVINVGSNGNTTPNSRLFGFLRWIRGVPVAMTINCRADETLTTPSHTHTWWSFDDIAWQWRKAAGDMQ